MQHIRPSLPLSPQPAHLSIHPPALPSIHVHPCIHPSIHPSIHPIATILIASATARTHFHLTFSHSFHQFTLPTIMRFASTGGTSTRIDYMLVPGQTDTEVSGQDVSTCRVSMRTGSGRSDPIDIFH